MRGKVIRSGLILSAVSGLGGPLGAQDARPSAADDVVVVATRPRPDVVVRAPPRCVRRPGDPADAVKVHRGRTEQREIAAGRDGRLVWRRSDERSVTAAAWQRAGTGIGQYVFRVPVLGLAGDPPSGSPMCIGAAGGSPSGWGQLRRIVPVERGMVGRYLHFSALVAARNAAEIRFWLVAAGQAEVYRGGDTHATPIKGTFGWRQVDIIVGPVPSYADHVSYGFLLWGGGDVWLTDPVLTVKTLAEVQGVPAVPTSPVKNF